MGKPKRQESQRQEVPGNGERSEPALFVAATPIGHLGDVSGRLRQVLGAGQRTLLCEDTRRTLDLCRALGIAAPGKLERCDAHTKSAQWARWVERAQAGERFVLVSDAGTPSISDPGAELVAAFVAAGLGVEALPGPSAVATALSIAVFAETAYVFWGFFPRAVGAQTESLAKAATFAAQGVRVHVWFESPERVEKSLQNAANIPGAEKVQAAAFRELTKLFETAYRGSLPEVARQIRDGGEVRGEWIFLLQWPVSEMAVAPPEAIDWQKPLEIALKAGASAAGAAREIAAAYGVARNLVYDKAVQLKKTSSGD